MGQMDAPRRKKMLDKAKGFRGFRSKLYRYAKDAVRKAMVYNYRDRKNRKREFRRLWIVRINAAARLHDLSYSRFMDGLRMQLRSRKIAVTTICPGFSSPRLTSSSPPACVSLAMPKSSSTMRPREVSFKLLGFFIQS